jgi:hypothetical protein
VARALSGGGFKAAWIILVGTPIVPLRFSPGT